MSPSLWYQWFSFHIYPARAHLETGPYLRGFEHTFQVHLYLRGRRQNDSLQF